MHRRSKKLYKKRYHRRSLAETAVSDGEEEVRSRALLEEKEGGQKNELRWKVITYNLSIIAKVTGSLWIVCQSPRRDPS